MKFSILAIMLAVAPVIATAQQPAPAPLAPAMLHDTLSLQDVVGIAQERGLAADAARSARDAARARDHAFAARLLPQFELQGQAANYQKGFTPLLVQSGQTQLITTNQNSSSFTANIPQQLP